ncbi:MAG TPA: amidohydrolase family protein, partial [Actinomycetes bacterium]|nr:amidohydrolase family protein [Actinomycetes bacterium]
MTQADLLIVGAPGYTADPARPWADAVAVRAGRVAAVGPEREVAVLRGPATRVLRLHGGLVLPGFQDAHVHAAFAGRILRNVNLDDLTDREAYLARIRAFADAHPSDDWIVGGGWYGPRFPEGGPIRQELDAAVPDRPVFLMNTDTHAAWVNTVALERAGIDASTPDPWDGYYVRERDGTPTGCLQEGAAYTFWARHVPADSVEDWIAAIRVAQGELHALG